MIAQIKEIILNPKTPKEVKIVGWYLIISIISLFIYLGLLYLIRFKNLYNH